MRSRERLIEVIDSLDVASTGAASLILAMAADVISNDYTAQSLLESALESVGEKHASPLIRELAAESLLYLKEDSHAP